MLFQPAIIALLLAAAANVVILFGAAPFAIDVIRHWDIRSGSERQLLLERRTYLVSSLLTFVMVTQLLALLLFVFNADKMAPLFVGAMCAVGALRADAYGFPALIAQITVFFLAAMWLAINHADTKSPDYPLVRTKYALLLGMSPGLLAAFALQLKYFSGLKADVLTSCCSRLFSAEAQGLSSDLVALPPLQTMMAFFGVLLLAMTAAAYAALRRRGGSAVALASMAAFVASVIGIVSFLSLYVYEHPHHHCPFCILKAEYHYQGYWLYVPLFAATAAGLGSGAVQRFSRVASLQEIAPRVSARLSAVAAGGFALFAAVACVLMLKSNLVLIGK